MIGEVQAINDSNHLDIRIDEGNKKDELAELAITFNRMLEQLEASFAAQKQFVYNISHELRTPLQPLSPNWNCPKRIIMIRKSTDK